MLLAKEASVVSEWERGGGGGGGGDKGMLQLFLGHSMIPWMLGAISPGKSLMRVTDIVYTFDPGMPVTWYS